MSVCVRFAPSPTGHVHIGNIRTALFNWLFARHEGGRFLLRVEDTDRERSTPEAVETVLESMAWLGLDYDGEPLYQSSRSAAHLEAAELLLEKGLAYKEDKGGTGQGECVVFRMPGRDMAYTDVVTGDRAKAAADLPDFVIVRSNGSPVFHLANVVDDIHMGITHVIRGNDHVENTFRHLALYAALGHEPPRFAHLPMIVNAQGKPYSKRDGDAYVGDFREKGFHPDALFNYLALLGWSPGDDREKMTRGEMTAAFSLERVKSGPAQMDLRKLTNLNGHYVAELPLDTFVEAARARVAGYDWGRDVDPAAFRTVAALMQSRTHLYTYTADWAYFFTDRFPYEEKAVRKLLKKDGIPEALAALRAGLTDADWSEDALEGAIRATEAAHDIREGKLNQPVRVALTGLSRGAGLYETMIVLGKERTLKRLDAVPEVVA